MWSGTSAGTQATWGSSLIRPVRMDRSHVTVGLLGTILASTAQSGNSPAAGLVSPNPAGPHILCTVRQWPLAVVCAIALCVATAVSRLAVGSALMCRWPTTPSASCRPSRLDQHLGHVRSLLQPLDAAPVHSRVGGWARGPQATAVFLGSRVISVKVFRFAGPPLPLAFTAYSIAPRETVLREDAWGGSIERKGSGRCCTPSPPR